MMRGLRRSAFVIVVVCMVVGGATGCLRRQFPTKSQYVVSVERSGATRSPGHGVLQVRSVTAAAAYDRKSLVYRTGESTYVDDFYNAFYVPPARMLGAVTRRWLADSGLFAAVVDADSVARSDWLLELKITDLYVDRTDEKEHVAVAGVDATLLAVEKGGSKAVFERHYVASEPAAARHGDAYVEAWGAALARVLDELEDDLAIAVSSR